MFWLTISLFLLLNLKITSSVEVDCGRIPPSFWCKSPEISKQCDVEKSCQNYIKKSTNKNVQLTLLYEALCPDCQQFINKVLYRNVYLKFGDLVDIELVPFGNAHVLENETVVCQHGPDECYANKFEACVIHYIAEPLPFIYCLETQLENRVGIEKAARKCYGTFHTAAHVADQITHCVNGKVGDDLIAAHAKRTQNVWPDQHKFVPWLVFNNASVADSQNWLQNIPAALCDWFVGDKEKLEKCGDISRVNYVSEPCYRNIDKMENSVEEF